MDGLSGTGREARLVRAGREVCRRARSVRLGRAVVAVEVRGCRRSSDNIWAELVERKGEREGESYVQKYKSFVQRRKEVVTLF